MYLEILMIPSALCEGDFSKFVKLLFSPAEWMVGSHLRGWIDPDRYMGKSKDVILVELIS